MMLTISVQNFAAWRKQARYLLQEEIAPDQVNWCDTTDKQMNLLSEINALTTTNTQKQHVPKEFITLAKKVACHSDFTKWDQLYQALWRLTHGEKHLLQLTIDPLMRALALKNKAVSRDMHKMKAFVRFRRYTHPEHTYYLAWHHPDHNILHLVANFFVKRFSDMHWIIMTPEQTAEWTKEKLIFRPGVPHDQFLSDTELEDLWRTYYRAIFNPARIKLQAMKREMPVRHWKTLPEAKIIADMLQEAPARVAKMLEEQK